MSRREGLDEKDWTQSTANPSRCRLEMEGTSHSSGQLRCNGYLAPEDWVALQQERPCTEQSEFAAGFPVRVT